MTERQGVEIDYCPKCRGVWLDRGELDKIIERSASASPQSSRTDHDARERRSEHDRYSERDEHKYPQTYKKKKKHESFLGELFDF